MIVAGSSDRFLRFWDASDGRLLGMLQAHAHRSYVIGVHDEGNDLVTRGFGVTTREFESLAGLLLSQLDADRSAVLA